MSSASTHASSTQRPQSPLDDDTRVTHLESAYSRVYEFFAGHHVHGDYNLIHALDSFASACDAMNDAVVSGNLSSLDANLERLRETHDAVGQSLWSSYNDLNIEAGKTTLRWSEVRDGPIHQLASLLNNTGCLTIPDRASGACILDNLRQEARAVFSRIPLAQCGPCSLCYIQDRPDWVILSDIFARDNHPCDVFGNSPKARDDLLCSSRDIERTFMEIVAPEKLENERHLSRTLGLRLPSSEWPLLDPPVDAKPDLLNSLKEVAKGEDDSMAFASVRAILWMICGLSIESAKAAKLTDALFLHVRINGIGFYLANAIRDLATPYYAGHLPDGTSIERFHRRLVHVVRLWHCVYSNPGDKPVLQAPPEVLSLIHSDVFAKWPYLRNGLGSGLILIVRQGSPSGPKMRASMRHQRRKTGSTGYDDELLGKFERKYEEGLRKSRRDAETYWVQRDKFESMPSPVNLSKGYAGLSDFSIISNITNEGISAFAASPQLLAVSLSCLQARLYGCIDFESWVIHQCQHAHDIWSMPRMLCADCKVDEAFMRERRYTEAIPLLVCDSILSQKTAAHRVVTALMWIKVANVLMGMHNWSGLRMVVHALVHLLARFAHHHIPIPDVSIRAMRRLHMLVFEEAPDDTQSHIDRLEHTSFTANERSLPYLGRFHETILRLAPSSARTYKRVPGELPVGHLCTAMRLSAYEELVQTIDWYESVNIDFLTARGEVALELAREAYERKKSQQKVESGVKLDVDLLKAQEEVGLKLAREGEDKKKLTLENCENDQDLLDRTLEGYVRYQLEDIFVKYPCTAQGREEIAAQALPVPYSLQSDEEPHSEGDVTLGQLLAAIHTYDGDIWAEAMKGEKPAVEVQRQPETPAKSPSLFRRVSRGLPTIEIYWG